MQRIGQQVVLSEMTSLGANVTIGNHVTFHGAVEVGDGATIFDGAVLGRPPMTTGNTTRVLAESAKPLKIGAGSILGANAVIYRGS